MAETLKAVEAERSAAEVREDRLRKLLNKEEAARKRLAEEVAKKHDAFGRFLSQHCDSGEANKHVNRVAAEYLLQKWMESQSGSALK